MSDVYAETVNTLRKSFEGRKPSGPKDEETFTERIMRWWEEERKSHTNTFNLMCDYIRENGELKKRIEELEQRNGT